VVQAVVLAYPVVMAGQAVAAVVQMVVYLRREVQAIPRLYLRHKETTVAVQMVLPQTMVVEVVVAHPQ
jgi:hypothetical protein